MASWIGTGAAIAVTLFGLSLFGRYEVHVDGYASAAFTPTMTHVVIPADEDQKHDLRFQEAAAEVSRALAAAGLPAPAPGQKPDVAVFVKFGVSEPRTVTRTTSEPVWGYTNTGTSNTTGTVTGIGGQAVINSTTTQNRQYGVVGSEQKTTSQTLYDRELVLQGVDVAKWSGTRDVENLWQVQVTSTGESNDIREALPYMLAAARPYLGRSTGKQIVVTVKQKDPEAEFIRTGVKPTK